MHKIFLYTSYVLSVLIWKCIFRDANVEKIANRRVVQRCECCNGYVGIHEQCSGKKKYLDNYVDVVRTVTHDV